LKNDSTFLFASSDGEILNDRVSPSTDESHCAMIDIIDDGLGETDEAILGCDVSDEALEAAAAAATAARSEYGGC
jgi:hypothetical protein